jgi:hypothetical protein
MKMEDASDDYRTLMLRIISVSTDGSGSHLLCYGFVFVSLISLENLVRGSFQSELHTSQRSQTGISLCYVWQISFA